MTTGDTKENSSLIGVFGNLRDALQAVDELKEARLGRTVRILEKEIQAGAEPKIEHVVIDACTDRTRAIDILKAYGAEIQDGETLSRDFAKGEERLKEEMGRMAHQLDREVATNKVPFEKPNRELGL